MPFGITEEEHGFTLVELLVVILIIGILAGVAVPAFLNQRKEATTASMKSDLRNAAMVMETSYIKDRIYPSTLPADVKESQGNTVVLADSLKPQRTAPIPVNQIPRSEANDSTVYTTTVTLNGAPQRIGYFLDLFVDPDGRRMSTQSRIVVFNPERTDGEFLQGFESSHPLVGERYISFRSGGRCVSNGEYRERTRSFEISAGNPIVVNNSMHSVDSVCTGGTTDGITEYRIAPNSVVGSMSWASARMPVKTTTLADLTKSTESKQNYCLEVSNPDIDSIFKYDSGSSRAVEGSC